ncbi:MAG TPA: hypothetical protein VFA13_12690 [Candidatus Acidoferrum sp.]|jgi:DUF4097 and DUF4098 domain-containing protein YvlB|nr:hypothetical protein [Candidatus Acidoferrum sp.]
MVHHGWRAAVLAGWLLGTAWTASALGISKDFDQKYPLQPGGTFELQNVNGTVDVQGWDRNEVEVRAVKTAKQRESDLERVSIDVQARPNAISVSTRYPQNEGVEVAVEYTIHVPHGASVEHLVTVNGTLRISDVDNIEELRTVNGNIEVFEGGGAVRAHTTNGTIHIELPRRQTKAVVAETMNGSVILALPADAQADLETRCLNGNFSSELPVSMESTAAPREMRGRLGAGGAAIRLRTVNGAIRIVSYRSTV